MPLKKILLFLLYSLVLLQARKLYYKEEFYRMYYLPQMFNNEDLQRGSFYLQLARAARFAPPIQALVICKTEDEYEKYKLLIRMHLSYLMAKNELFLAARYDKHEPVFFNKPYADHILESLDIAEYHYRCAGEYWQEMLDFKSRAQSQYPKIRTPLEFTEDLMVRIDSGELDLDRVMNRKLEKIIKTRAFFGENAP